MDLDCRSLFQNVRRKINVKWINKAVMDVRREKSFYEFTVSAVGVRVAVVSVIANKSSGRLAILVFSAGIVAVIISIIASGWKIS